MLVIVMVPAAARSVMMLALVLSAATAAFTVFMRVGGVMMVLMVVATAAILAMLMGMVIVMVVRMPTMSMMMIMVMSVRVPMCLKIRTAFGVERGFNRPDLAAKPRHHFLDHMVAADAQASAGDLHGQVPVAEMPGELQEMIRPFGADLAQRLGRADNLDEASILQLHRVACAQRHGFRQVEQELHTADGTQRDPPAMAIVELQHDTVGRIARPITLRDDFDCPDHLSFLNSFAARGARPPPGWPRQRQGTGPEGSS